MFLTFFLGVLVIFVVKCRSRRIQNFVFGRNVNFPMLNMVNIMFGGALNILPRRNFARFLLGMFMLYTIVIRNAYTGTLFRFLQTSASNRDIISINQLIKGNYSFMVLEALKEFTDNFPKISKNSVILKKGRFIEIRHLLLDSEVKRALLASEDHVAYWNKRHFPEEIFDVVDEKASSINLVMYLHKTSCLTSEFSRQILNFNSVGLVKIFKQVYIDKKYSKPQVDREPKKLTNTHLEGAFELLAIGIASSFCCFLIEVLLKIIKNRIRSF